MRLDKLNPPSRPNLHTSKLFIKYMIKELLKANILL